MYAIITKITDWEKGSRKEFIIKSVKTTSNSQISVLGQSGELLEYQPTVDASTYFEQKEDGIHISSMRAQRIYNNNKWHNPLVLKITNAEPALVPPIVETVNTEKTTQDKLILKGKL